MTPSPPITAGRLSWGRFPNYPQTVSPVYWQEDIANSLQHSSSRFGTTLAIGNTRSYGDSCLAASDQVLDMRPLDRFIEIDWQAGTLVAEAGVTLEQILHLTIPKGWFLPVLPGTQYVTLGGALANDIHGKNHHRQGTFGRHVRRFGLIRSDQGVLTCTPTEHPELFAATIGGLGLTGVIAWLEIQLIPIRSSNIDVRLIPFASLHDFFQIADEMESRHEYTVAWIDCLTHGRSAGRGIFMSGDHGTDGQLAVSRKKKVRVPVTPPISMVGTYTVRAFNQLYYHANRSTAGARRTDYDSYFFPLDRILEWNRIYGRPGFQQFQCIVPHAQAEPALAAMLDHIARRGAGSFLAVLKRCGDLKSPALLSFPMPGVSLALDFPQHESLTSSLFPRLDAIVRDAGGRLYAAKDAHMSGDDFRQAYPAWSQLESLRDPALNSRFWTRIAST